MSLFSFVGDRIKENEIQLQSVRINKLYPYSKHNKICVIKHAEGPLLDSRETFIEREKQ